MWIFNPHFSKNLIFSCFNCSLDEPRQIVFTFCWNFRNFHLKLAQLQKSWNSRGGAGQSFHIFSKKSLMLNMCARVVRAHYCARRNGTPYPVYTDHKWFVKRSNIEKDICIWNEKIRNFENGFCPTPLANEVVVFDKVCLADSPFGFHTM